MNDWVKVVCHYRATTNNTNNNNNDNNINNKNNEDIETEYFFLEENGRLNVESLSQLFGFFVSNFEYVALVYEIML